MVNPNLIKLAKRTGNGDLPKEEIPKEEPKTTSPNPEFQEAYDPRILTFDDYGRELIRKSNEIYSGTKAEIPLGSDNEEIDNMHILKRLALITTIYNNNQLRGQGLWPITPFQSEQLLKEGNLPKPEEYWEDLALILYDTQGTNQKEAQALYESLQRNKDQLGLSSSDLENRLLMVNAGLEIDSDMPNGVKPIVLPDLTKVYLHDTLQRTGEDHNFEYGLEYGLPSVSELGNGNRTLYMPSENENIGLRGLYRNGNLDLLAWYGVLAVSDSVGRVVIARQGAL
jgi:hypothetical protein